MGISAVRPYRRRGHLLAGLVVTATTSGTLDLGTVGVVPLMTV